MGRTLVRPKRGVFFAGLMLLLVLPGCHSSSHEQVVLQQVRIYEEVVEILRGVQDAAGMEAARERLREKNEEMARLTRLARQLPEPSQEVREQIAPHVPRLQTAWRNFHAEARRIRALPNGSRFLEEISQLK